MTRHRLFIVALACVSLLGLSSPSLAAITRVQCVVGDTGSGTGAMIITISATGSGNFLAVGVAEYSNGATAPTFTDSSGAGSYLTGYDLNVNTGTTGRQTVAYKENIAAGITTVTVTPTGSTTASAIVCEYAGVATASSKDVAIVATHNDAAATSWSSNAITTTTTDLVIGFSQTRNSAAATFAVSGAWGGGVDVPNSGDGDDAFFEDQRSVASGSYTATGTAANHTYDTGAVSFKAAGGGATAVLRGTLIGVLP